jgi:hypothetical protein
LFKPEVQEAGKYDAHPVQRQEPVRREKEVKMYINQS